MFDEFCENVEIGDMQKEAFEISASEYARLKASGNNLDDADIFIASYCIANRYTLVTNNTKHFQLFSNLSITNWL
jgi:predicted nucleic acid-binding protein